MPDITNCPKNKEKKAVKTRMFLLPFLLWDSNE